MRSINDEEQAWVEEVARTFDALVFWTTGRYGAQPLLLPRRAWTRKRRVRVSPQRSA